VWILTGILLQSPLAFLLLCAVLWWSALLPKLNPFDALYNLLFGGNRLTAFYLTPAPVPRRTAQAMAGIFALSCGLFLHFGFFTAAYVMEAVFVAAVLALILAGFCLGSFVFHLLSGKAGFACRTLPWAKQHEKGPLNKLTTGQ
jgi:Na+-translocating ferredoxin:NAD+ oxidoreductase RnfD subunit